MAGLARLARGLTVRVAIIGAGYAGMAAAATLAADGIPATVFESSRVLGGRARRVECRGRRFDNGQHILVGAYTELLRLMRLVGADPALLLERRPLSLTFPGHMRLVAPRLPAPLHLAAALLTARGLPFAARLDALRFMRAMKQTGFRLERDMSFADLMARQRQHAAAIRYLWQPLCVSALNTPPQDASAQVFLNVLRDTLAARREASDLLLPRVDFSALFPEPAERFVRERGGDVRRGAAIRSVIQHPDGFILTGDTSGRIYTHVIAAVAPGHLPRLVATLPRLQPVLDDIAAFAYEPILTAYLGYPQPVRLPDAMTGVGETAHFLFQHTDDVLAAVVSVSRPLLSLPHAAIIERIHAEVRSIVGDAPAPAWFRVIAEKRATFACRPGMRRPACETPLENFYLCGDYVASDYPATLEAAARSGIACARLVSRKAA
ncbi:MAG: hydroxysqualene dehydroxylase HpnE [Zoogloeaceae bacterium]|nr:hydroxysqualene dehydroxylase HpnE [Zoogloeaceae bacterium]